jgi:hypothetical protein
MLSLIFRALPRGFSGNFYRRNSGEFRLEKLSCEVNLAPLTEQLRPGDRILPILALSHADLPRGQQCPRLQQLAPFAPRAAAFQKQR